jgi:hypothetical protein
MPGSLFDGMPLKFVHDDVEHLLPPSDFSSLAEVASSLQGQFRSLVRYVYKVALSATCTLSVTSITLTVKSFTGVGRLCLPAFFVRGP